MVAGWVTYGDPLTVDAVHPRYAGTGQLTDGDAKVDFAAGVLCGAPAAAVSMAA